MDIQKMVDYARYSSHLEDVLAKLQAVEVLRVEYESDYQGFVDIDVLLADGRVFTYKYWYGSCSGCDEWESRELSSEEICEEMLKEATLYPNIELYKEWRATVKQFQSFVCRGGIGRHNYAYALRVRVPPTHQSYFNSQELLCTFTIL